MMFLGTYADLSLILPVFLSLKLLIQSIPYPFKKMFALLFTRSAAIHPLATTEYVI